MPNCLIIDGILYEIDGEITRTFSTRTVTTTEFGYKLDEPVLESIEVKGTFVKCGVVNQIN